MMETVQGFDFSRLHFDENGNLQQAANFTDLLKQAKAASATDAILLAHGFRNDENDALGLYTDFLGTFRNHIMGGSFPTLPNQRFVVAGVFWPSKKFQESPQRDGSVEALDPETAEKLEVIAKLLDLKVTVATEEQKPKMDRAIQLLDQVKFSDGAQSEFVDCVLSLLANTDLDPTEGVDRLLASEGSELLNKLGTSVEVPTAADDGNDGGVLGVERLPAGNSDIGGVEGIGSLPGSIFGRIGQFLNFTTWYTMKSRSGVVGANGVAKCVRDLQASIPNLRVHLVGHSLGGRLMAACAKTLGEKPTLQPASLTLLEAAFSHYGFSRNNGEGKPGFFRSVVDTQVIKGPFISTFSAQDTVVGKIYAIASRLVDDNVKAIGDANDMFGGIGRNGAQKTAEATSERLHAVGTTYQFQPGKIQCLDGSNGLIRDHGDIRNPVVTYAFASAVAATVPVTQCAGK